MHGHQPEKTNHLYRLEAFPDDLYHMLKVSYAGRPGRVLTTYGSNHEPHHLRISLSPSGSICFGTGIYRPDSRLECSVTGVKSNKYTSDTSVVHFTRAQDSRPHSQWRDFRLRGFRRTEQSPDELKYHQEDKGWIGHYKRWLLMRGWGYLMAFLLVTGGLYYYLDSISTVALLETEAIDVVYTWVNGSDP
ncbi:hypothetical protein PROFUN_12678, partial [Planoprotostelium fungivorum]